MPTYPSEAEINKLVLDKVETGPVQFGPLAILIIGAIISAVVSHLVKKCLNNIDPVEIRNPGIIRRWQLRRIVRKACDDPKVLATALKSGLGTQGLTKNYSGPVYDALLKAAAEV